MNKHKFIEKQILLLGLISKPDAPTELGVAWRWAEAYASAGHVVTLVTHTSQKAHYADFKIPKNIRVVFVGRNVKFQANPASLLQAVGLMLAALDWCRSVIFWAKREKIDFYFVHHPSISSVRLPSPLFGLTGSRYWGPLGGGHLGELRGLKLNNLTYEFVRNVSIYSLTMLSKLIMPKRVRIGLTALATNDATEKLLNKVGFEKVIFEVSDGIYPPKMSTLNEKNLGFEDSQKRIIWAGRLVGSKRPRVAVLAVNELVKMGWSAQLDFYGSGDPSTLNSLARELGVGKNINFMGPVSWNNLMNSLSKYDITLFTSGRDSSSPFLLESLYSGVKCVAIRTQVVQSIFPENLVAGPRSQGESDNVLALQIAQEIHSWLLRPEQEKIEVLRQGYVFAQSQTWEQKAKRILALRDETRPSI